MHPRSTRGIPGALSPAECTSTSSDTATTTANAHLELLAIRIHLAQLIKQEQLLRNVFICRQACKRHTVRSWRQGNTTAGMLLPGVLLLCTCTHLGPRCLSWPAPSAMSCGPHGSCRAVWQRASASKRTRRTHRWHRLCPAPLVPGRSAAVAAPALLLSVVAGAVPAVRRWPATVQAGGGAAAGTACFDWTGAVQTGFSSAGWCCFWTGKWSQSVSTSWCIYLLYLLVVVRLASPYARAGEEEDLILIGMGLERGIGSSACK